jgi:hypothetical protein
VTRPLEVPLVAVTVSRDHQHPGCLGGATAEIDQVNVSGFNQRLDWSIGHRIHRIQNEANTVGRGAGRARGDIGICGQVVHECLPRYLGRNRRAGHLARPQRRATGILLQHCRQSLRASRCGGAYPRHILSANIEGRHR